MQNSVSICVPANIQLDEDIITNLNKLVSSPVCQGIECELDNQKLRDSLPSSWTWNQKCTTFFKAILNHDMEFR